MEVKVNLTLSFYELGVIRTLLAAKVSEFNYDRDAKFETEFEHTVSLLYDKVKYVCSTPKDM